MTDTSGAGQGRHDALMSIGTGDDYVQCNVSPCPSGNNTNNNNNTPTRASMV